MKVFEQLIRVEPQHIDGLQHVNNVVYVQWVQNIAEAHWNSLAPDEIKKRYAWVVLKHEIEYLSPAFLHDVLRARTWVAESAGARSVRKVEIYRQSDGRKMITASTTWCLLDAATGKPRRIETDILKLFHA
ncbi:MAG: acyl-CoA thioesterase [Cyclobacteriaceae bacterium]|nr:acyl-CoA thioesterase [Cyclobacteriaceae bacterium]